MPIQSTTGKLTNSELKVQSFFFDCADPGVNFTDGTYSTDLVIKNKSFITATYIKYEEDVSAYPAMNIDIQTNSAYGFVLNYDGLPLANIVDGYAVGTTVPLGGVVGGGNNNNNVQVLVRILGMTGSGISSLKFTVVVIYVEMEI